MKKPDEIELMKRIQSKPYGKPVKDVIKEMDMNLNRAYSILNKWAGQGLYEYGISVFLGWLTTEGEKIKWED